jgi:hypothetical protein
MTAKPETAVSAYPDAPILSGVVDDAKYDPLVDRLEVPSFESLWEAV